MQRINAADSEVAITCRDVLLRSPQNSTFGFLRTLKKKTAGTVYSTLLFVTEWLRCLFVVQTMEPTQNVPFESKAPAPLPLGVCV